MKKFEHLVITDRMEIYQLEKKGWELISVIYNTKEETEKYFLKRPFVETVNIEMD